MNCYIFDTLLFLNDRHLDYLHFQKSVVICYGECNKNEFHVIHSTLFSFKIACVFFTLLLQLSTSFTTWKCVSSLHYLILYFTQPTITSAQSWAYHQASDSTLTKHVKLPLKSPFDYSSFIFTHRGVLIHALLP